MLEQPYMKIKNINLYKIEIRIEIKIENYKYIILILYYIILY